jgi:hypothetical protein
MSDPVISFKAERKKDTLATYHVGRNEFGLRDQINFNEPHYIEKDGKRFGNMEGGANARLYFTSRYISTCTT